MYVAPSGTVFTGEGQRKLAWSQGWVSYWSPQNRTNPYNKKNDERFEYFERGFREACAKFGPAV